VPRIFRVTDDQMNLNLNGSLFRLWAVASLVWISFIFIFAYQQISTGRHVSVGAYISYATSAFVPVCGIFAIIFISGWIIAGFIGPR
jgi:hypothetical protein